MDDLMADLGLAFNETFQMLSISTVLTIVGGGGVGDLAIRFGDYLTKPKS